MIMEHQGLLKLLVLFLGLSCVLSSLAVPSTRSLAIEKEDSLAMDSLAQDTKYGEELFETGAGSLGRRMDIESNDYPGTGPNPGHDPNQPPAKT